MIKIETVTQFANERFQEQNASDRITDNGYSYHISTQPREYLDTKDQSKMTFGNGPIVILKESGEVYSFSSNPNDVRIYSAPSQQEFKDLLAERGYDLDPEQVLL